LSCLHGSFHWIRQLRDNLTNQIQREIIVLVMMCIAFESYQRGVL